MPRRRTVVRTLVFGTLLLILAALIGNAALDSWGRRSWARAKERFEREVGPLDLEKYRRPAVPLETNAATWIRAGSLAVVLPASPPGTTAPVGLAMVPAKDWSAPERDAVRRALELNADALAIVAKARGMTESSWDIDTRAGTTAKIPNLLAIINASKLLAVRARLAAEEGRLDDALTDYETLGAVAGSLEQEPVVITMLIGAAVEGYQAGVAHDLLARPGLDAESLGRIERGVIAGDLGGAYRRAFSFDIASTAWAVRKNFEGQSEFDADDSRARLVPASVREVAAATLLEMAVACHGALEISRGVPDAFAEQVAKETHGPFRKVLAPTMPNLVSGFGRMVHKASLRRFVHLGVALRLRALQGGRYPAALTGLPGADGPDPFTRRALRYERRADGSATIEAPGTAESAKALFPPDVAKHTPLVWTVPGTDLRTLRK